MSDIAPSDTVPRSAGEVVELITAAPTQISRRAGMPIPNWLNFGLVLFVFVTSLALLYLGSQLSTWYAALAVGIVFSYLQLTNYALLHEATHYNLNENLLRNYWLGVWTGVLFPVPFTLIRLTHQGHHLRNRTDTEMFDLYYPEDNRLYKYWIWYGTISGGFWPLVPIGAILIGLLPRPLYEQLFTAPPWRNPALDALTLGQRWQIRFELLLIVAVWIGMFWLLDLRWLPVVLCYACFSFNWSTRQYVAHAFSKRDIIDGAWNLRHNRAMSKILLHGNWDLNHHRYPEVPWYYLPRLPSPETVSYARQYWKQWLGPRLTTESPPS